MVMKGLKKNSLYLSQGTTLIGMVATVVNSSNNSSVSLWQIRLNHVSDRRMHVHGIPSMWTELEALVRGWKDIRAFH